MTKHKCGMLHTVSISSLYIMLFMNGSGEIMNCHCAKLPSERFRQKWGSDIKNTWCWMNYILWFTLGVPRPVLGLIVLTTVLKSLIYL